MLFQEVHGRRLHLQSPVLPLSLAAVSPGFAMALKPTNAALLDDIVERIASAHPRARILLFGSRAEGTARPDSDYDLVIVTPDLHPGEPAAARARRALRGLAVGFDLIVVTPAQWDAMRAVRGSVAREAEATAKVLRDAA
jgi:predicted nucleotidyltransferase